MNAFELKIEESWNQYRLEKANQLYPNIMLLGVTGAGKSSLINRIFGVDIAAVSNTNPETSGYDTFYCGKDYGLSVNIIDTAGYEMDQADFYYNEIRNSIVNGVKGEAIHIAWYCIPIVKRRIEDMDIYILKNLIKEDSIRKRLCVVFTKCDEDDNQGSVANTFRNILNNEVYQGIKTFETSAHPDLPLDLEQLIKWSADSIDEKDLRNNFIASQFVDLNTKKEEAKKIIATGATAAAAAGAIPFPFADSIVLVPIQVKMIASIIDIYGVTNLASISATVVSDVLISQLGRSAAKALVSLIPGAGLILNIATSTINAAVASSITSAIGFAISEICYSNVKKFLNGESIAWDKVFDEDIIKKYMKKFSKSN